MSAIETYLDELASALNVRGAPRRRLLRECRDHLLDAAAERGEQAAVHAFGAPAEIAAAFDAEVATRRGLRATFATVTAVVATGGSTLVLIQAASPGASALTMRDLVEHASVGGALVTASVEAAAVACAFVALGRLLGLRHY